MLSTEIFTQSAESIDVIISSFSTLFICFFTSSSSSSVFPFLYLIFCFMSSPFLWEMTQNDPQGLMCHYKTKNLDNWGSCLLCGNDCVWKTVYETVTQALFILLMTFICLPKLDN